MPREKKIRLLCDQFWKRVNQYIKKLNKVEKYILLHAYRAHTLHIMDNYIVKIKMFF